MWWGFAIFYIFDGIGLTMSKSKVKKESIGGYMKILVPVDGSKHSMEGLKVAAHYAKTKGGAEVSVMTVTLILLISTLNFPRQNATAFLKA